VTGRWLSKDPIGIAGGLNQYTFCESDPVNSRDPSGLCKRKHQPGFVTPESLRAMRLAQELENQERITGVICPPNPWVAVGFIGSLIRGRFPRSEEPDPLEPFVGKRRIGVAPTIFGRAVGRGYPAKMNRVRLQPYDPATGRYLPYSANPGVALSPVARFTAGFGQGVAEAKGAAGGGTPLGSAGALGHALGRIIGSLF